MNVNMGITMSEKGGSHLNVYGLGVKGRMQGNNQTIADIAKQAEEIRKAKDAIDKDPTLSQSLREKKQQELKEQLEGLNKQLDDFDDENQMKIVEEEAMANQMETMVEQGTKAGQSPEEVMNTMQMQNVVKEFVKMESTGEDSTEAIEQLSEQNQKLEALSKTLEEQKKNESEQAVDVLL